jgi:hypothetical protein
MQSGSIIDIPLLKIKCPTAVNISMAAIAILAEMITLKLPRNILIVNKEIEKTVSKISNGFIIFLAKVRI